MPLVMGVDSSTQSTKVEVRDADSGVLVAAGSAPHPPTTPPISEQDPEQWWAAFEEAWRRAGAPAVAAVAVAGQQHGLVALDASATPVRPALLWNDTRSAADADALITELGGAGRWAMTCGTVPVASLTITKLRWLRRNEPEAFARITKVLLPHDWLTFKLCGAFATDRGDASGTGYWSPFEGRWRTDVLALVDPMVDWDRVLPQVLDPLDHAGVWNGAVVAAGTGDNMAAALGLGLEIGQVVVSLGTSGTVFSRSATPTADPTGAVAGFADATGAFLPLVCTSNAMKVTDAVMRLIGASPSKFDALALASRSEGLTLLPYFDGERTPNRPDATGVLSGLRSDITAGQLARAAVEGVLCGILDALDALERVTGGSSRDRLVLVGGGSRSDAYRQLLSDLSGREVLVPDVSEAVATGACVQAAAALHAANALEVAAAWGLNGAVSSIARPRSSDAAAIRARYRDLRDAALPGVRAEAGDSTSSMPRRRRDTSH